MTPTRRSAAHLTAGDFAAAWRAAREALPGFAFYFHHIYPDRLLVDHDGGRLILGDHLSGDEMVAAFVEGVERLVGAGADVVSLGLHRHSAG